MDRQQQQQQQQVERQRSAVLTEHFLPTQNELEREQRLIDQGLVCPVTQNPFEDPVRASDGHLYERRFIEEWIATCRAGGRRVTSPLTRAVLTDVLTPAPEVRDAVLALQRPGNQLREPGSIKFEPPFFKQLDKFLETQLVRSLNLRPPAIVPLGVESAGKSTVLERIMGLTLLPRDEQMCTRMVIRVHLRRRREAARAAVRLVIRSRTAPFAEDASTERHVAALDFIAENVKQMMDAAVAQAQQAIVMDRELLVEVFRPDAPNLDIIDVPGLVTAERPGLENAPALTAKLVEDVIAAERGHGIFLVILPATEQANTSVTMRLVQKHRLQDTSLGIRTKLDLKHPQNADDTRAEVVTMEVLGSVPDPSSATGARLRAPGFVDLALGWLGMANISSRRALNNVVSHHRERYRLVQMDEAEVKLWAQLQATDDNNVLPLLEGRFGRRAAVHYVQKQFERFIVEHWLPKVRDVLQRHYFDVSAEYLARGAPVPVERAADDARAPMDSEAMRTAVARVADDVEQFIPGDAESVFAVRAAFAASPEEMKRVFDQRLEATAAVSVENDWTGVMDLAPVWQAVAEVEAAVRLVEEMGDQPVAPAHATRLISGNKSRLRQATDRAVEALCSFATTGLVDRFVDAFDAAPSRSVELPAAGALPVRKLTSQLRLRERLPEVAEALKQHALAAVRLAADGEFRTSAAALIDREIDDAYMAARASAAAGGARGEFVVRTIQAERTKLLGARVVDLFVAVVIGGLAASLRQWAVRPDLLVEAAPFRTARLGDLRRLVDAGDALHSLKALQASIDPNLGQAAAPPARNTWGRHVSQLISVLPQPA